MGVVGSLDQSVGLSMDRYYIKVNRSFVFSRNMIWSLMNTELWSSAAVPIISVRRRNKILRFVRV